MRNKRIGTMFEAKSLPRHKFDSLLHSDPSIPSSTNDDDFSTRNSSVSIATPAYYDQNPMSPDSSPINMSPWNQTSPYAKSPWSTSSPINQFHENFPPNGLIGSLFREEGHIYSLAATGDLLYTGSDSKNIRVWKSQKEFSGFKSNSGLVKAIVISGEKIFTGHQDGKIRVWKVSSKDPSIHKRLGTLPTLKDFIKSSVNPSNYVHVRRRRNVVRIKHFDAVSSLSLNEDQGLLYSSSWDKTVKVWRISDSKCLESISAHDDAVNSVVAGFDGLIFTGSADGSVKIWRRELQGKGTKHCFIQTLLKQDCAVTALAVNPSASVVYCGSSDGLVNFWERENHLSHGGVLRGHKLAVLCLAAAGSLVFSGSADKTICVWRRESGAHTCLSVLTGHTGPVKCLAVEEDHESVNRDQPWILYSGSLDKSVKVWRVSEKALDLQQNTPEGGPPSDSLPSTHGFSSSRSMSLNRLNRAWRILDSKCLESICAHDDAVNSVVAGFDGLIFTGSADGSVKIGRRELQGKGTKHCFIQTLLKQDCAVTALAVNPSASVVYCGSSDGLVNFWERENHLSHGGVLRGHKLAVLCLAAAGSLVFSESVDKTICVWRRESGAHTCLSVLTSHTGPVKWLAVEEDHESANRDQQWILYSGSLDKSVKVWRVSEKAPDLQQNTP
ncbi:hypothetical protein HHK36_021653 [Tetracentron sinense]|uniref:Uncharacterized protein n=1 Tax=Tetracentron sinense TaxID=13715 RepID=A0A835DAU9_TETSI|nr:hypothetical protein HHK36_021653 [Tetracentron sinense]